MIKLSAKQREIIKSSILKELWKTSIFDKDALEQLEKITNQTSESKDSSFEISEEVSFTLSTLRNKNLITTKKQEKLSKTTVAFFGLSVGSHAAITWVMQSRAHNIKIADPDTIDPTNLNRLRFGWDSVGKSKAEVVRNQIEQISPFTKIVSTTEVTKEKVLQLLNAKPKTDIIVDEIDDLEGKIFLRNYAKKQRIPIICATDIGDNVSVDIERYDTDKNLKIFNNRMKDISEEKATNMSEAQRIKTLINYVGFEHNSEEMLESLDQIGQTLVTWPQLGATATISGGIVATTIKKIICEENVKSGRYYISLDDILTTEKKQTKERKKELIKKLTKKFKLK